MPWSKYFKAKRQWLLSNGGALRLIHMDDGDAFNKIHGEDLSHIFWDELRHEADPQVVLMARSSMRTTDPTVVPKFTATANPLSPGSWWIRDYVVTKAMPNRIFNCEFFGAQPAVCMKSTLMHNPYLSNPDQYEQELRSSCFGDESRIAAEVLGEWGQFTAGFFGSCLSIERSMLTADFQIPWYPHKSGSFTEKTKAHWCWVGGDWVKASPVCVVMMCQIQESMMVGDRHIARGSWVCVDEEYVCSIQTDGTKEWNIVDRSLTAPQFVERVKKLYMRNGFTDWVIPTRRVIMDSANTAQLGFGGHSDPVTLKTEFKIYGWQVTGSPKSNRAVGWQLMKSLLWQAGSEEPGLFISERCESLWATFPYCISDDRNPEDMEKSEPNHSADAERYVLFAANQGQHSYRQSQRSGSHPLMWGNEQKSR